MTKKSIFFVFLLIFISLISYSISEMKPPDKIKIYSKDIFNINCDSHFFYLSMNLSNTYAVEDLIPFELTLLSPQDLKFKCIIDTLQRELQCFTFVPLGLSYRKQDLFFHLFYYPPKVPGVDFDSNSFIKHSRKWEDTTQCGLDNHLLNLSQVDYSYWNKISVNKLFGGDCISLYEDKEQKNFFYFNMTIGIEDENIINILNDTNGLKMVMSQEIKAPVYLKYKKYDSATSVVSRDYAYCISNKLIDINNYNSIDLTCKISLQKKSVLFGFIQISSFFDKIYVKFINKDKYEFKIFNIFCKINDTNDRVYKVSNKTGFEYLILDDNKGNNILCPNKPIFTIKNKKDGIYYDSYSNITNRYTFYLKGTLRNGFKYENESLIQLSQTSEEISFPLVLTDNTLINSDEMDSHVKCILSSSTIYDQEDGTLIKCFGEKRGESPEIDLTLNYVQKKNNNCSNIIINWPDAQYYGNKKSIYSYKITALSLQQKDFICDDGNYFTFYINIYDLNKEPKIWFKLPLLTPEGITAHCELFDQMTLICSIDLRYKKLLKNTKITLHKKGTELKIVNEDGNENIFVVNDYADLGNEEYYYIALREDCGENVVFGTLQDMGLSKKNSIILTICGGLFMLLLIGFCFVYIIHCFKLRCKRGKKLATTEESRG